MAPSPFSFPHFPCQCPFLYDDLQRAVKLTLGSLHFKLKVNAQNFSVDCELVMEKGPWNWLRPSPCSDETVFKLANEKRHFHDAPTRNTTHVS
jgi:hypothetical protein